jgi:hypothetical protein
LGTCMYLGWRIFSREFGWLLFLGYVIPDHFKFFKFGIFFSLIHCFVVFTR